jgi:hypothetical protein
MWGALSDEKTCLSFARVTVSSVKSVVNMYSLHFTCYQMYVYINICIYNIYKASVSPGSVQQIIPYY